jgi:ArsR family transcriptional regulator, arsenate/arsenite/antimonite-responsive transcriptional repressor
MAPNNLLVLRALAHESRLRIVDALLPGPLSVEDLAQRLDLAASTVSHHLKTLLAARLVVRKRDQYYAFFSIAEGWLDRPLRDLVSTTSVDKQAQIDRQLAGDVKILTRFFENGRLRVMPRQKKKRDLVLDFFAAGFEPDRTYAEREVNEVIRRHHDDHCSIRRYLVDRGTLDRSGGQYQLKTGLDTHKHQENMSRRKQLIESYKRKPRVAGVYRISHTSGRSLWGTSINVQARLNRHRAQLGMGSHESPGLQADWAAGRVEDFTMEVLDSVEDSQEPGFVLADELEALAELWADRLDPAQLDVYA